MNEVIMVLVQNNASISMSSPQEDNPQNQNPPGQSSALVPGANQMLAERTISEKEFVELIALADSLRQYDGRKTDQTFRERIEQKLGENEGLPLAVVYEIAEETSISRQYVERAIELLYPSRDVQLNDIARHKARPTIDAILNSHQQEILQSLRKNVPHGLYRAELWSYTEYHGVHKSVDVYSVEKKLTEKGFWLWRKTVAEETLNRVVRVEYYHRDEYSDATGKHEKIHSSLTLTLDSPLVLRTCNETLLALQERFEKQVAEYKILYDYAVK